MSSLISRLGWAADRFPDRLALRSRQRSVSYGQLPFLVTAMAARIGKADPGGLPVALFLPEPVEWLIAHLALRQLDRATVCLAADIASGDVPRELSDAGASSLLSPDGLFCLPQTQPVRLEGAAIVSVPGPSSLARHAWKFVERDLFVLSDLDVPMPILPAAIFALYGKLHRAEECEVEDWLPFETVCFWMATLSSKRHLTITA